MINKSEVLKKISENDDRLLVSRILDKAELVSKTGSIAFTDFLDPRQRILSERVLRGIKELSFAFYGGYEGAERVLAILGPSFIPAEDISQLIETVGSKKVMKNIEINIRKCGTLTHRDYLGALMSLGIKREKIGDILVRTENAGSHCSIYAISEIAEFIAINLNKIGNISVEAELKEISESEPEIIEEALEIITSVASLRLDCIVSSGFGVSREKASEAIKSEKIKLNWEVSKNLSKQVNEGDTISFRGKGRIVLNNIGGNTRKGRVRLSLRRLS